MKVLFLILSIIIYFGQAKASEPTLTTDQEQTINYYAEQCYKYNTYCEYAEKQIDTLNLNGETKQFEDSLEDN